MATPVSEAAARTVGRGRQPIGRFLPWYLSGRRPKHYAASDLGAAPSEVPYAFRELSSTSVVTVRQLRVVAAVRRARSK